MTKSTITRERLLEIIVTGPEASGAEQNELARMVLTAMDSEPVAWRWRWSDDTEGYWRYTEEQRETRGSVTAQPLYLHAQPAPERDQVRSAHAEWSQATFGNVGPVGPLKHLSKEALEAAAEPGDLSEWADMQFLMWDAQRRAGITDEQITQAMIEKLAVNKQREWPEPKDGEPRLHINEQPALTGNSPVIGIDLASGPDRTVEVRYVAPPGYVMVPKDLLSELRDWAHPEIEKYCEMWEGRRDSEFPALRKVIADADALLAAAPQEGK